MARPLCLAALLLLCAGSASAALMSIDLGTEYLKVSIVPAGKAPVGVVVNEMSRRKSPALVGFLNGERLVGEEAFSFAVRAPETVYQRARDLLGKLATDGTISQMLEEHGLPYRIVPHPSRGVASVQPNATGPVYSAEELVASILQYARGIAEEAAGTPVLDAVITVPAFFGQAQRQALVDAGRLAGLNVLGLINQHTAAALQYGIERDFINKTQHVVLYDQGSGSTQVALVRYSHYVVKEGGKPKEYSQLEVRDVDWDASLGSNNLDMLLANHVAKQFMDKHKITTDIRKNAKAMAKLRRQVRRTKEVLSANTFALVSVEELYGGHDFQGQVSRAEFEAMAGDFFERAAKPLQRLLKRNNLRVEDIEAIELIGGGSRTPRLQAMLSEILGGRQLDRHLDADEAVVLGAGLFAANLSTSFRLRKFGISDVSMYGVQLQVNEIKQAPADSTLTEGQDTVLEDEATTKVHNLLPFMKKVPIKRVVHFANVTGDPIRFTLAYNTSTPSGLPPGVTSPELGHFHVTGVDTVIHRYNTSGLVNLRFEADYGGLLSLERVEAAVEYEVMEEKIVEVKEDVAGNITAAEASPAANGTANSTIATNKAEAATSDDKAGGTSADNVEPAAAAGAPKAGSANGTDGDTKGAAKNGTASSIRRVMVPRKKLAKVALNVSGPGWKHASLSGADWDVAAKNLATWQHAENTKRDNAKAKNDLESYIIKTRDILESGETLQEVTTDEQRKTFSAALSKQEDWLYGDGEFEEAAEFRNRLAALKDIGEPIKKRALEHALRPQLVEDITRSIDLRRKVINAWAENKPWINETEAAEVLEKVQDLESWFSGKVAEQSKLAAHEEPAFTSDEVAARVEALDRVFNRVSNKRKPKPPPEVVTSANGTANGTTNATVDGSSSVGDNSTASSNDTADMAKEGQDRPAEQGAANTDKSTDSSNSSNAKKSAADKKAEEKRKADDKKKAEAKRKADDAKKAEEKKKTGSAKDKKAGNGKDSANGSKKAPEKSGNKAGGSGKGTKDKAASGRGSNKPEEEL